MVGLGFILVREERGRESAVDVNLLYSQARRSFGVWKDTSLSERLDYLRALRYVMVESVDEIVDVIQKSTGKVAFEALTAEVLTVIDTIAYWEKEAHKILGIRKVPTPLLLQRRRSWIEFKPRGVVLVISPWNYPFQLTAIPMLAAVVAGNTVIVKPSEVTPEIGGLLARLIEKAGFPEDVVQIIDGDGDVGAALVSGKPDFIFFTGSVRTGKEIQKTAAEHLIPTVLELGGKDAMIVLDDAPLERSVNGALWGAFTNCGQVCMSTERLYVQKGIYESFSEKLVSALQHVTMGEMTSAAQVQIVRDQIEDALEKGARLLVGVPPSQWEEDSMEIRPTVLVNVNEDMAIWHEETFGPVVPLIPFESEKEVVESVNGSPFGLSASVWSQDLKRGKKLAEQLDAGSININDVMITVANPHLPFGGVKASGLGRYHGCEGLRVFCHETAFMASKGTRRTELNWYPYTEEKYDFVLSVLENIFGRKKRWGRIIKKAVNPRIWQ
jgi:acyl-CoA reductase-like NAD-dependent aldehyde dehydrogenase